MITFTVERLLALIVILMATPTAFSSGTGPASSNTVIVRIIFIICLVLATVWLLVSLF